MRVHIYLFIISCYLVSGSLLPFHVAQQTNTLDFAAIDNYVTSQMQSDQIPGLALGIVQGNSIVHLRGFGVANATGQAVTATTSFIMGSISKSFTALAIMQLVEKGQIELDTPVIRYIPWFRMRDTEASNKITIRDLLNQVSGIPSYAGAKSLAENGTATLEQRVQELSTVDVTAPVGKTFQYSEDNYVVLGLIIQAVSGQSYAQYIQQHIFAPLQMHHSFISQTDAMRNGMATGHLWWFGMPVAANLPYPADSLPASFIISSAEDMTHYLIVQMNNGSYGSTSILEPAGIAELHRPAPAAVIPLTGDHYAMGWVVGSHRGTAVIWHGGDVANFHADMVIVPQKQLGIILMDNVNNALIQLEELGKIGRIAAGVTDLLLGYQPSDDVLSVRTFYFIFDLVAVLLIALQTSSLVLVLRHRHRPFQLPSRRLVLRTLLPLLWELALPCGLLIILAIVLNIFDIPLHIIMLYSPDFSSWATVILLLLLITGITRIGLFFFRTHRSNTHNNVTVAPSIQPENG